MLRARSWTGFAAAHVVETPGLGTQEGLSWAEVMF